MVRTERSAWKITPCTFRNISEKFEGNFYGGRLRKYVSITDENTEYRFHLNGIGEKELEPFRDMILRQAEKLKQTATKQTPFFQKEVITKEVVMIPCDYCRSLMPQTSTFCPSCGARRKC